MLHRKSENHAPAIGSVVHHNHIVAEMKKREMKQAIVEHFVYREKAAAPNAAGRKYVRSPYWQAVDDEC